MQNGMTNMGSRRHRVIERVRDFAGHVKWSYLELEDHLKCHFWNLFSGSRARCSDRECQVCNAKANGSTAVPQTRDKKLSILLQKIRTWPRLGSRRVRDHSSRDCQKREDDPSSQVAKDRIKAASFPAKHRDLSRARFLPRFKKFESINEESHGGPTATEGQLPNDIDVPYINVVGMEIEDAGAGVTTSVEELSKYDFSFGSEGSFGTREDSMAKSLTGSQVFQRDRSMMEEIPPTSADSNEVSEGGRSESPAFDSALYVAGAGQAETVIPDIPEACESLHADGVPQSRFHGVRWKARKWTSEIRPTNAKRTVWLGTYATEEEAASAFDAGIFYFNKQRDYNFPDSEESLPPLNPYMDERAQLNFIKTQARLIAKRRAQMMAKQPAPVTMARNSLPQASPRTPDTSSSAAGPSAFSRTKTGPSSSRSMFFSHKRNKSGEASLQKNSRRKF